MVGAVIVDAAEDRVIGEGYHAEYGGLHAERAALVDCIRRRENPAGATIYVSLEPCAHTGRQPPCAEALAEARLGRVVIASNDPTPKANGAGPELLRKQGIEVEFAPKPGEDGGSVRDAAELLNQPFRKRAATGLPWVVLKLATSLDGKVALPGGKSRWISSSESRAMAHGWRSELDAVAIGSGTALADDPELTVRDGDRIDESAGQPRRVVFDSACRTPPDSRLVATIQLAPLTVLTTAWAPVERRQALLDAGVDVCVVDHSGSDSSRDLRVGIEPALRALVEREAGSVLVEGGPALAGSLVRGGFVDEWRQFIAPIALGGGIAALDMPAPPELDNAYALPELAAEPVGRDLLVSSTARRW